MPDNQQPAAEPLTAITTELTNLANGSLAHGDKLAASICRNAIRVLEHQAGQLAELRQEIDNAWTTLAEYGIDSLCDLAQEGESPEDVTLDTGIQQLGEMAYQWRTEAEAAREK